MSERTAEREDVVVDASTGKVLSMITKEDDLVFGDDENIFGRMPVGLDESEFDAIPPDEWEMSEEDAEMLQGDEGEAPAPVFEAPAKEQFPVFKSALRHFQEREPRGRVVRIDTDASYGDFVCERAVKEIDRRVRELREALEQHLSDGHGPSSLGIRQWSTDIIGAARSVRDLRRARTADEAADAMPKVPVDVPPFAEGRVRCWRDGAAIVCSIRFEAADGTPRFATMASRPRVDAEEVAVSAIQSGVDPVTVLGALPDLAAVACSKRLVRDAADAALAASAREDILGQTEPLLFTSAPSSPAVAPLAALMYTQQRAEAGDAQAAEEMARIRRAADTPTGQKVAAPLLEEASARLAAGRAKKAEEFRKSQRFCNRYAEMSLCL